MATASEILVDVHELLARYSLAFAVDGGTKVLTLNRATAGDSGLVAWSEAGGERFRAGQLGGSTEWRLQRSPTGAEVDYTDVLTVNRATGVSVLSGNVGIGIAAPLAGLHTLAGVATNSQVPAYSWLGDITGARWVSGLGSYLLSYFTDHADTASLPERGSVSAYGETFRSKIAFTGTGDILAVGNARFAGTYTATTAAAANMVVDASGNYTRSTSSEKYKRDIEAADPGLLRSVVMAAEPIWYRSLCNADPDAWSWWGLSAEAMAGIDPRFVQWRTEGPVTVTQCFERRLDDGSVIEEECEVVEMQPLDPADYVAEGVAYERLTVALISVAQQQAETIAELEARLAVLEAA